MSNIELNNLRLIIQYLVKIYSNISKQIWVFFFLTNVNINSIINKSKLSGSFYWKILFIYQENKKEKEKEDKESNFLKYYIKYLI